MKRWTLTDFMRESLRIEGIHRPPTNAELAATERFLGLRGIIPADLVRLVEVYAPGHLLRSEPHLNVRVGDYIAPRGGPEVVLALSDLLFACNERRIDAWNAHVAYETLHPFTDGNGRSGRALWLWMQGGDAPIGFLHQFYYQTLAASPGRKDGKGHRSL